MLGNLKKRKTYSIIICILVFFTGLILTVTISTVQSANQAFDSSFNNMEGPHLNYWFLENNFKPEFEEWFKNQQGVESVKLVNTSFINGGVLEQVGRTLRESSDYTLLKYNPSDGMRLIDAYYPAENKLSEGEIYLPYLFKTKYKLSTGENVDFAFGSQKMVFKIVGFIEDPLSGGDMDDSKFLFVSSADIDRLNELGAEKVNHYIQMRVRFSEYIEITVNRTGNKFLEKYGSKVNFVKDYSLMKVPILTLPKIALIVLITFSALLCLITIAILRYAILATIEADYLNIGIVKALGFTPLMVLISITGQYALLAFISGVLSLIAGIIITPVVGQIMLNSSGLYFSGMLDFVVGLLILLVLVLIISLFSYITASRTKKITPVRAITNGIAPVYFSSRLNVRLENLRFLPFDIRMALKQVLSKSKRYILLIFISALFSYALVFSFGLLQLFNSEKALNMLGAEFSDIELDTGTKAEVIKIISEIKKDYDVEWITLRRSTQINVEGNKITAKVKDDFDLTGELTNLEGRHPKHNNEAAISYLVKERIGKGVGEYISIKDKMNMTHQFIITGVFQTIDEGGALVRIPESGMKVLDPKFELNEAYIKLKDHSDVDDTINEMKANYTDYEELSNERKQTQDKIDTIKSVFSIISKLVFVLTIIMISFITLLIMKITVYAETNELGVYKALGFSSARIRLQLAQRFLIVTLSGGIIGVLLEALFGSEIFSLALRGAGISSVRIDFNFLTALITVTIISLIALLSAYVSSGNVKKVSAYTLIKE